jgi:hypothetical protein
MDCYVMWMVSYTFTKKSSMKNLKFVDLNRTLVNKVQALGIEAKCADYFLESCRTPRPVLMTASNPNFTMGGGIDWHFKENYPHLVKFKQAKGGENERIGNIIFAVTVNEDLKADRETVKKAIEFALQETAENETLLLSGVGTGIGANGNFTEDDFIEVLKELLLA